MRRSYFTLRSYIHFIVITKIYTFQHINCFLLVMLFFLVRKSSDLFVCCRSGPNHSFSKDGKMPHSFLSNLATNS